MKEVSYNNVLGEDIENSKFKVNLLSLFGSIASMLITATNVTILLYLAFKFENIMNALFYVGVSSLVLSGTLAVMFSQQSKKHKQKALESLSSLKNDLNIVGVNLSLADIQKSVVTEQKRDLKEINRNGEVSKSQEIIRRYYMLDEQQQIQVLQQTLTQYRSETTNKDTMQLQLLEDEDLKNIELPETIITKRLQFNDTKK